MLVWCLTGCGATPSLPAPASPLLGSYSFTPAPSRTPTGKLTLAGLHFPDAANPLFASSDADLAIDNALWARPIFYDQHFHAHPDQLTEVPLPQNGDVRDGGKTIVMHLRHDLRWSDGQPIVASDFLYWWQLDQNSDTGATVTDGYSRIASIDTPDAFTLVLHMKQPFGPYLFYLPYAAPQHAWGHLRPIDLQNTPSVYQAPQVTSGPYKLVSMADGQRYTLAPNTYYTSSTFHGPYLAQLVYQGYANAAALSAAARSQSVDVTLDYMEDDLPDLAHLPTGVNMLEASAAAYEHLDFNLARPFFHDSNVRRAIQMAIDTCGIIRSVLHAPDCSRRATQVEVPPSLFYDASIQPAPYDPAMARRLLAQAGWSPNAQDILSRQGQLLSLRLVTTADNPVRAAAAQAIQRDLRAVGIQVQIATYSLNSFFGLYTQGGILATGAYDLALFTYANSPEPDDEYGVFASSQIPDAAHPDLGNYGRVDDAVIDQALIAGRTSVDFAQRVAAYHRFLERLAQQVYMIPLYTEVNIMTVAARVHNVIPNPDQSATTWNVSDWWVS
jgi:peptide/nickel transport system substrate-binding protein